MPYRSAPANTTGRVISVPDRRRFFAAVARTAKAELPANLAAFHNSGTFNLMKVWFTYQRVHFEVVLDQSIDRIEIGLHFEDGPASSLAYLALLDQHILAIKEVLGVQSDLERWTQSWVRIYELLPLGELTAERGVEVGHRLGLYIKTLWPLVESSGIRHEREI